MCIKHALGGVDGYFCTPLCCTKVCKEEQQHLFPSPDDKEIEQLYKFYEQQFIMPCMHSVIQAVPLWYGLQD
jgi:hypothetical protein